MLLLSAASRSFRRSRASLRVPAAAVTSPARQAVVHDTSPFVNQRDLEFMTDEYIDCASLLKLSRYEQHDMESIKGVISSAVDLAENEFYPLYQAGDKTWPQYDRENDVVVHPKGQVEAVQKYCEQGFLGLIFDNVCTTVLCVVVSTPESVYWYIRIIGIRRLAVTYSRLCYYSSSICGCELGSGWDEFRCHPGSGQPHPHVCEQGARGQVGPSDRDGRVIRNHVLVGAPCWLIIDGC